MRLRILEGQLGVLEILSYLYKKKKSYIYDLVENTQINKTTIYYALKRLKDEGLIYDEPEVPGFGRPKRWIYLTEKGKKVAEELVKIEKILQEK